MSDELPINHEEAKELAEAKQLESNLARCYLNLAYRLSSEEIAHAQTVANFQSMVASWADERSSLMGRLDSATQNHESQLGIMRAQRERILELEGRLDSLRSVIGRDGYQAKNGGNGGRQLLESLQSLLVVENLVSNSEKGKAI